MIEIIYCFWVLQSIGGYIWLWWLMKWKVMGNWLRCKVHYRKSQIMKVVAVIIYHDWNKLKTTRPENLFLNLKFLCCKWGGKKFKTAHPMMIGVWTDVFIFGHSMPPTLPKIQKMNIYTNLSEKNIYFKILQKKIYILKFQKKITKIINNLYFIICKGGY